VPFQSEIFIPKADNVYQKNYILNMDCE